MIKKNKKNMIIYCVEKNAKGIITNLGWSYEVSDKVDSENPNKVRNSSKEDFISQCKSNGLENNIKTIKDKSVSIISDKYLRTDGDNIQDNDMVDLDSCTHYKLNEGLKIISESFSDGTFLKNAIIL